MKCGSSTFSLETNETSKYAKSRTYHVFFPTSLCNGTADANANDNADANDDANDELLVVDSDHENSNNILSITDLDRIGIRKLPLVFALHSWHRNADLFSFWEDLAQEFNFVLVRPEGVFGSWNAQVCCSRANTMGIDEESFFSQMISSLASMTHGFLDKNLVYALGWSNGAFMISRIAHFFQAIAPISGYQYNTTEYPTFAGNRSISLFQHHGLTDTGVNFQGFVWMDRQRDTHVWRKLSKR